MPICEANSSTRSSKHQIDELVMSSLGPMGPMSGFQFPNPERSLNCVGLEKFRRDILDDESELLHFGIPLRWESRLL